MTGIIVLAAGSSSRLGKPKQNLVYQGQTLLQRAIIAATSPKCGAVIVVLGANAEQIIPTIGNVDIHIVQNPNWQEGMASSIRLGIIELKKIQPDTDSAILMLCDQPFVDSSLLHQLIQKKSAKGIVASGYNDTAGPPVLFHSVYFDELLLLRGHEGAKKLFSKYKDDITIVQFAPGGVDIDTMEDFRKL